MKKIIKAAAVIASVILISVLIADQSRYESGNRLFFAMDTVMNLSAEAKDVNEKLDELESSINNLDAELSRTMEGSLIYRLNNSVRASAQLSDDALKLFDEALKLKDFTQGTFDISIAPVMDLWGFTSGEFRVPEDDEIQQALKAVGMEHIHLKNGIISLDEGSKLDLGGIAKGYALEKSRDFFKENHVRRGIAYMGGDILAYGSKGGEPWVIAIEDPQPLEGEAKYLGLLHLRNSYVMTSGNYQRYFIQDGERYHHILDPNTGYPAESGLSSVSIIADAKGSGPMCDALATALFVMGKDRAIEFWRDNPGIFEFVLVTDEGDVLVSKGLENFFAPVKPEKYNYQLIR